MSMSSQFELGLSFVGVMTLFDFVGYAKLTSNFILNICNSRIVTVLLLLSTCVIIRPNDHLVQLMHRLRFLRPSSYIRTPKHSPTTRRLKPWTPPNLIGELHSFIKDRPDEDPTNLIFKRLRKAHPCGNVPFSEYNSLFDWLTRHNLQHAAMRIFVAMRVSGYASLASTESKLILMLMKEWDLEDKVMQRALTERLVSLVQEEDFTEKDMYELVRLAVDMDRRVILFAMHSFLRAKGDITQYIPALDLLPVAVEAAVRSGSVDEAFAMLDAVGVVFKEEVGSREEPILTARVSPELSIRRDLGQFQFKSRSAAQRSLRVAYTSLLTSLRDVGAWKSDIHIVGRALTLLKAAGVQPDTSLLNLSMMQAVYIKRFTQVPSTYTKMRSKGLAKGQWPDEHTYGVLFGLFWEALMEKASLHEAFHPLSPRILFRDLLEATDPVYVKERIASAYTQSPIPPGNKITAKPLVINEKLLMHILSAFLHQRDYAAAYVALSYLTSKAANVTINSWHAVYYVVVHHLIRRVFAEPPGPYGEARWSEGFLGTSLRGNGPTNNVIRFEAGSVGSKDESERPHRPIGSVRLPLNAQTTNYLLEVIARKEWSITDPLYPRAGELPTNSTHLFYTLASTPSEELGRKPNSKSDTTSRGPKSTGTRNRHEYKYSVPSMFMMEHVDPPNLPPEFAWSAGPLQRLLLRAIYADEVLAYRRTGQPSKGGIHRSLYMPHDVITECTGNVKQRVFEACNRMLPLDRQRSAVLMTFEGH